MSKRVRITLEVDSKFVRLLNAKVGLADLRNRDKLDPAQVLALVALAEMRGGTEVEIHALTPIEWRNHIQVIHEERRVEELDGSL